MLIIGHRGCAYEPENTLRSFEKAMGLGIDMLEFDVHTTKDNQLVIIHDPKLNRTTNGIGYVKNYSVNELKHFDAGKGEKIPLLNELYDLAYGYAELNLEIKCNGIEELVVEFLTKRNAVENTIISSFNHQALIKIKQLCPNVRTGLLVYGVPIDITDLLTKTKAFSYHPDNEFILSEHIKEAHTAGCKIYAYTVNDIPQAEYLYSYGIDGLITDYPDKIDEAIKTL